MLISNRPPTLSFPGERRVIFRNLTWQNYQSILQSVGEHRSTRLTYACGTLEMTMPLEDHEFAKELIGLFIRVLVVELGLRLKSMGSTTLDRQDLDRGAEPDCAFYIQHYAQVSGRSIDLEQDPPPDLVVEIDITHSDINKLDLYSNMGVPEFWRYDGHLLKIYQLQGSGYERTEVSSTFPWVPTTRLYKFLEQASVDEVAAELALRKWVQKHRPRD
ncbi:MAG: Uma2 family endonuclease [Thermosynechococcaceae cyanobacterium]